MYSTLAITLDGDAIVSGDSSSVTIVYKNINGSNFAQKKVWSEGTHQEYLEYLRNEVGKPFSSGSVVQLMRLDSGEVLDTHVL